MCEPYRCAVPKSDLAAASDPDGWCRRIREKADTLLAYRGRPVPDRRQRLLRMLLAGGQAARDREPGAPRMEPVGARPFASVSGRRERKLKLLGHTKEEAFMPSAAHDELELREIAPGYASRFTDWGGMTVVFEKAHAGQAASAMVKGLPGDRCQAPHWGFLFSGKIVVHFDDRTETIEGGQAYYIAPGHAIEFLETAKRSSSRRRLRSNGPSPRSGVTPRHPATQTRE
jgi:hypothetical protein